MVAHRKREIRLQGPRLDLGEQRLAKSGQVGGGCLGIRVLRGEVGDGRRIFTVGEPGVFVGAGVPVECPFGRSTVGNGGLGRRLGHEHERYRRARRAVVREASAVLSPARPLASSSRHRTPRHPRSLPDTQGRYRNTSSKPHTSRKSEVAPIAAEPFCESNSSCRFLRHLHGRLPVAAKWQWVSESDHAVPRTTAWRARMTTALEQLTARLRAELGPASVITDAATLRAYECDGLTAYRATPGVVCRLPETSEIQACVRACASALGVPFVARGSRAPGSPAARCRIATGALIVTRQAEPHDRHRSGRASSAIVEPAVVNLAITQAVAATRPLLRARSVQPASPAPSAATSRRTPAARTA